MEEVYILFVKESIDTNYLIILNNTNILLIDIRNKQVRTINAAFFK